MSLFRLLTNLCRFLCGFLLLGNITDAALSIPLEFKESKNPGLEAIDPTSIGLNFTGSKAKTSFQTTQYLENAGVAVGDINADGLPDIFLCGADAPSKLFINLGDWKFKDATTLAGLNLKDSYINAASFADGDNDGDLDLFLGSLYNQPLYFTNNGMGQFKQSDQVDWQLTPIGGITSFALADIDNDGDLDLYTSRYLNTVIADRLTAADFQQLVQSELAKLKNNTPLGKRFTDRYSLQPTSSNGKSSYSVIENGLNDILYINNGNGHFSPAENDASRFKNDAGQTIQLPQDWGLSAAFHDFDNDGDADLYVCNDFESPDRIWINDGNGFFTPIQNNAIRHIPFASSNVSFADLNNDGHDDFLVLNKLDSPHKSIPDSTLPQYSKSALYLNRGDQTYAEIALFSGLDSLSSDWSWASLFADLDLDGFKELIITRGVNRDYTNPKIIDQLNQQQINQGPFTVNQTLQTQSRFPKYPLNNQIFHHQGNLRFEEVSSQWGLNESLISGGLASADFDNDGDLDLIINNSDAPPSLYRNNNNRPRVSIRLVGTPSNSHAIGASLTLNNGSFIQNIELTAGGIYASGSTTTASFAIPHPDQPIELSINWPNRTQSIYPNLLPNRKYILFQSDSDAIVSKNQDITPSSLFKDISNQMGSPPNSLEPSLKNTNPIASSNLASGISWADINNDLLDDILLPSPSGNNLLFFLNRKDHFDALQNFEALLDQTTILSQQNTEGDVSFIVGQSNRDTSSSQSTPPFIPFSFIKNKGWIHQKFPTPNQANTSALSQADLDGDGDLDLFVAGRNIPNNILQPASSSIYINNVNDYQRHEKLSAAFKDIGFVSAAALGDLDDDGDPDLILALKNDSIRIFKKTGSHFLDATSDYQIPPQAGLWNGITFGDFNNDGRLDFVASNWGKNSPPPQTSIPLDRLAHSVFINQGDHFTLVDLPDEAQFTSAFGLNVADFNSDGFDDIFLAQNTRAPLANQVPNNAGRGLILLGNGDGSFRPLPGQSSGIINYADQRGSAISDFNQDGRVDLAVAQSNNQIRLYQNINSPQGLRVRLTGSKQNTNAIGAVIRIKYKSGWGPARLITSGSGYLSQDSATQVFSLQSKIELIKIRWPNGQVVQYPMQDQFPSLDCSIDQIKGIHWIINNP